MAIKKIPIHLSSNVSTIINTTCFRIQTLKKTMLKKKTILIKMIFVLPNIFGDFIFFRLVLIFRFDKYFLSNWFCMSRFINSLTKFVYYNFY